MSSTTTINTIVLKLSSSGFSRWEWEDRRLLNREVKMVEVVKKKEGVKEEQFIFFDRSLIRTNLGFQERSWWQRSGGSRWLLIFSSIKNIKSRNWRNPQWLCNFFFVQYMDGDYFVRGSLSTKVQIRNI